MKFLITKEEWKQTFDLFWTFFKISPVSFGGGFAMIPLIEKEIVIKKGWLTREEIADVFAITQSIPGAVAINCAIFIGQKIGGIKGAFAALLGISIPTFIIVILLSKIYHLVKGNPVVDSMMTFIKITIVALILNAGIRISKTAIIDKYTLVITLLSVILLFFIHPVLLILVGGFAGVISVHLRNKKPSILKGER